MRYDVPVRCNMSHFVSSVESKWSEFWHAAIPCMDKLLYISDLADILGITPNAVRCRLAQRNPNVPPPARLPRPGRLCWRQSDVEKWLADLPTIEPRPSCGPGPRTRRRNRNEIPPKLEEFPPEWRPYLTAQHTSQERQDVSR